MVLLHGNLRPRVLDMPFALLDSLAVRRSSGQWEGFAVIHHNRPHL